jgi:amidase
MPQHAFVLQLSMGSAEGPRFAVKDTLDVAGTPTRAGSAALEDAPLRGESALVVQRLLDAGWQLVGKTALHELAYGTTGINHHTGTPVNPLWPDRVPGGSSSGSAVAVAAGTVALALGTDTGGSVRTPAACCNVFGLKPTFGRLSRAGVMPGTSSLDCVGPLAADMHWLVRAMRDMDPGFAPLPPLQRPVRIGLLDVAADPLAQAAVAHALTRVDASVAARTLPGFDAAYQAGLTLINRENALALGHLLDAPGLGADVRARLAKACATTAEDYAAANAVRARFTAAVDAALDGLDVLALPTLATTAPLLVDAGDTLAAVAMTRLVRPFNVSGHPAITVPLCNRDGLPVGLQLVARRGADELLCAVASLFGAAPSLSPTRETA